MEQPLYLDAAPLAAVTDLINDHCLALVSYERAEVKFFTVFLYQSQRTMEHRFALT